MWGQMFKKYEDLEQRNELTREVSLDDIDNPETIHMIVKESSKYNFIKPRTILRQYFLEHAEEIDEIATIAGPPASDEEVLSDDSDDESLSISSGTDAPSLISEGDIKVNDDHAPVTPPTSESSDENNEDEIPNANEASSSDNNETLIGYDDEDDVPLYSSKPQRGLVSISGQGENSLSSPQEPNAKKPKLQPERLDITNQTLDVEIDGVTNNYEDAAGEHNENSKCLVCSKCNVTTFYEALPKSPGFECDECLVGEHMECEVEECSQCKYLGEVVTERREAEVIGRVEKLTGRRINQLREAEVIGRVEKLTGINQL